LKSKKPVLKDHTFRIPFIYDVHSRQIYRHRNQVSGSIEVADDSDQKILVLLTGEEESTQKTWM
jgi:hypothetical protein